MNEPWLWQAITLLIVTIALAVVAIACAMKRVRSFVGKRERDIPRFGMSNVEWDEYPTEIDVENQFDCNARSLRECKLDDPTTLFGCRELAVRCHHFDKDTVYYHEGERTTIPRNATPNDGYALAITSLADSCNPYHGDLVLVTKNADSNDYMLVCECKNPGYIGNDDVLGSCTDVYICDGKINDIEQPLEKIECVCNERETNARYEDGLPVCKTMLVRDANERYPDGWTHLVPWSSDRLIDLKVFNATIRDNLRTRQLLDPCRNALDAPIVEIRNGEYRADTKTCRFVDYGLPVRVNMLEGNDNDASGGDDRRETKEPETPYRTLDAAIRTSRHLAVRLGDRMAGKRMTINLRTRMPDYIDDGENRDVYATLPDNVGFGGNAQLHLTMRKQMIGGRCEGTWPTYTCVFREYFDGTLFDVPYPGYRAPPGSFLWNREDWVASERAVHFGVIIKDRGVTLDNDTLGARARWTAYGMQYCHAETPNCQNGMLSFISESDFQKHRQILT